MKYLALIIFIISTVIHLYASFHRNKSLRNITKPFILLSLMGYYCFGTDRIRIAVILALLFSWIGDILLIPEGNNWFTAGGISFMVSHFFFVLSYLKDVDFKAVSPVAIAVLALFFGILVNIIFHRLRPYLPKALFYPMYLYLLINGTMNCFAIFRFLSCPDLAGIVTVIGAALFFVSDTSLFFVRFKKNGSIKTHFIVMLTYSIGELLIVLGLMMK